MRSEEYGHPAGLCGSAGLLPVVITVGTLEANLSLFYHHRFNRKYLEPPIKGEAGLGPDPFDKNRFTRNIKHNCDGYDTFPVIPPGPEGDKALDTDSNPLDEA